MLIWKPSVTGPKTKTGKNVNAPKIKMIEAGWVSAKPSKPELLPVAADAWVIED